jgi:DNA topoisomerase I
VKVAQLLPVLDSLCDVLALYVQLRARRAGMTLDADWEESKHPRAENGEFGHGGASAAKPAAASVPAHPTETASATAPTPRTGMHPATAAERKDLKVPPAWTDVHVTDDPNSSLQVVGRDSKGRAQYRYSAAHSDKAKAVKIERGSAFKEDLKMFGPKLERAAYTPGSNQEEAAVLRLIHLTAFRIGSDTDTKAKVKAYGASTLRAEHVSIDGSNITFDFIGKKGIHIQKTISDPNMAALLASRVKRGGALFNTNEAKTLNYLHREMGPYKIHDFRFWHGTKEAMKAIAGMPTPVTPKEFARSRQAVGKVVAAWLGNTPDMALKAYINPDVFSEWEVASGRH